MVTRYSDDKKAPRQEESDRPGQRFDKEKEPADVAHPEGVASSASAEGGTVFTVIAPGLQFGYSFCPDVACYIFRPVERVHAVSMCRCDFVRRQRW